MHEIAGSAGEDDERERLFNMKVDEVFSLPVAEQAKLPTLIDWKVKKQLQELEMWTKQIMVKDPPQLILFFVCVYGVQGTNRHA